MVKNFILAEVLYSNGDVPNGGGALLKWGRP